MYSLRESKRTDHLLAHAAFYVHTVNQLRYPAGGGEVLP